jgi:ABC-2 type transport system ATP-binding protein
MAAVLVAEDVRKRYGDTAALGGVSLTVGEGEVFGLIGPNGAGKTTLVRALTGTTPVEGHVSVFDEAPTETDPQRVGLLPQSFDPPARLTPRELVDYYGGLYDEARETDAVLADVGLAETADTWYEKLSGGQQRRTCVATALVNDPDVLFLDEPTTGIDPAGRRALWSLVGSLADGGTTVFLTTHSMTEAERLSDRVGLLNDGELVAVGAPGDLVAEYGGSERLAFETAAVAEAREALTAAGYAVDPEPDGVVVPHVAATDIGPVVELLAEAGVDYDALTWKQPDLEEVYLRLTGERLAPEREPTPAAADDGVDAVRPDGESARAESEATATPTGSESTTEGDR